MWNVGETCPSSHDETSGNLEGSGWNGSKSDTGKGCQPCLSLSAGLAHDKRLGRENVADTGGLRVRLPAAASQYDHRSNDDNEARRHLVARDPAPAAPDEEHGASRDHADDDRVEQEPRPPAVSCEEHVDLRCRV